MCHVPGEFALVECARCGFLYLSPRPDRSEIHQYYPAEYSFYTTPSREEMPPFFRAVYDEHLASQRRIVRDHAGDGRVLLDIGCAGGGFLETMKAEGWHVRGVEPDPRAARRARDLHGIDVVNGYLEDAPFAPASFDAVTLWEVLEHVPDPLATLRRIHEILRPGGAVVMSVPNRGSFQAKLIRSYWIGYDFPRHLSVFSPAHLRSALRKTGFDAPRIFGQRGRMGAMHNELFALSGSLDLWLGEEPGDSLRQRLVHPVWNVAFRKPAAIAPLFLATLPLSILLRKLNRGTNMVAVARKPAVA